MHMSREERKKLVVVVIILITITRIFLITRKHESIFEYNNEIFYTFITMWFYKGRNLSKVTEFAQSRKLKLMIYYSTNESCFTYG